MVNCVSILDELEFYPVTNESERIVSNFLKKSLALLGRTSYEQLMSYLSSMYKLSEKELLREYALIEKELTNIFGIGTKIILEKVKIEMLEYIRSKNTSSPVNRYLIDLAKEPAKLHNVDLENLGLALDVILKEVQVVEVFSFVRQLANREHILFLYEDENAIENVLSEFFDPQMTAEPTKGLISDKPTKLPVNNLLYGQLLDVEKSMVIKRLSDWVNRLHLSNRSGTATRIADEDCTWYIRNGFGEEHLKLEESLGRSPKDRMIALCAYNISKMPKEQIKSIVGWHGYVILDRPFTVYKSRS